MKSIRSEASIPPELAEAFERVRDRLGRLGSQVLYFSTIGSTNDVAASIAAGPGVGEAIEPAVGESIEPVKEGTIVIADAQTAGRGRRGRTWFSPPASGLYVSIVLMPARARHDPERATTLLTLAAGVALAEGIETATGLAPDIKWPNDLLIGRRKLGGILAEGVTSPDGPMFVILGYGINVGPASYPPDLADRATSLETELGRPIDHAMVCSETLAAVSARYGDLLEGRFDAILDAWRRRAPSHRGARVSWETASGAQSGITSGIDDRGALLVNVGTRMERIVGGELTWL